MAMTYAQCEAKLKAQLQKLYDTGEAAAITDLVLEEYTGKNRHLRKVLTLAEISENECTAIDTAAQQLLQGKPVQYVLGYTEFYGLRFKVNEAVLIPRPETEELIDWVIKDYKGNTVNLQVIDIGTGSGCIPMCLKKHLPHAKITAIDISAAALAVATQNAALYQLNVQFREFDFIEENNWQQLGKYNVIVSNPPYIPRQEAATMSQHVTDWEPATALFVPDETPLLFYEKIAQFGKSHLQANGTIYLEAHKDYASQVQQLFAAQGYTAQLRKDMHGNERMVKAVFS